MDDRVVPEKGYHATVHGIRFREVLFALERCARVMPDRRTDEAGRPRHPHGFVAWGRHPNGGLLRVDFNFDENRKPPLLYVATAFQVSP